MAGNLPLTSIRGHGGVSSVNSYPFRGGYSNPAAAKQLSKSFAPALADDYSNGRSSMFLVPRRGGGGGGGRLVSHVNHISGTGKLHLDYNEKQATYWKNLRSLMSRGVPRSQAVALATREAGREASTFYRNRLNAALSSPMASQNPLAASHLTRQTPAAGGIFDLWNSRASTYGWARDSGNSPAPAHTAERDSQNLLFSPDDGANGGGALASISSQANQAFSSAYAGNPYPISAKDEYKPSDFSTLPPAAPTLKEEESTRGTYQ